MTSGIAGSLKRAPIKDQHHDFFSLDKKFEYRITKFETISNDTNPNDRNVFMTNTVLKSKIFSMVEAFEHSNFGFIDLTETPGRQSL